MIRQISPEGRQYRHELKFICHERELQLIEAGVRCICRKDAHAGAGGVYRIRSVYLDTVDDRYYAENEAGLDGREKYRIRIYNASEDFIRLERKGTLRGLKYKEDCAITRAQCEAVLQGRPVAEVAEEQRLLQTFLLEREQELLSPRVLVAYVRTPYVYPVGNVRITFDREISSARPEQFFAEHLHSRPVLPEGVHILEVKYDEVLPTALLECINGGLSLTRTSFSKYALCRKYSLV